MKYFFAIVLLMLIACQSLPSPLLRRDKCHTETVLWQKDHFQVKAVKYSLGEPSRQAVIIYPPTGGATYLERNYSHKLCRAGFDVFVYEEWTGMNEEATDLQLHQRLYTRAMQAMELTLESIPHKFIGVMGTSVGGTFAAVAMGKFAKIDTALVIAAGISIAEVIVFSDQSAMKKLSKERKLKFKFKNDLEYFKALEQEFDLEPYKLPKLFEDKPLGMILLSQDSTVPFKTQENLKKLWDPAWTRQLKSKHFWGIIKTWWNFDQDIVEFFSESADL